MLLSFYEPNISRTKVITVFAVLMAVVELVRVLGVINISVGYIILIPMSVLPLLLWAFRYTSRILRAYLLFLMYIPISTLLASPSPVFHSWSRYFLFLLVMLLVSPLVQNIRMRFFRFTCLKTILMLAIPFSAASFFCYFLGINYFRRGDSLVDYMTAIGGFSGLFSHSMMLGPFSALCSSACVWGAVRTQKRRYLLILLAILCAGATLFSASRSAVAGLLLSVIMILYYSGQKRTKGLKYLVVAALLGCASYPLWQDTTQGIIAKNESNANLGEYGSRTLKFNSRFAEIADSPIIGIGFSAIDPHGRDYYDPKTGVVEPGSSWLGVWSMTGFIGLAFIVYFFIRTFNILRKSTSPYASLMLGLMTFFAFHLFFEGYIYAGGSILCFMFWLVMGVSYDLKHAQLPSKR